MTQEPDKSSIPETETNEVRTMLNGAIKNGRALLWSLGIANRYATNVECEIDRLTKELKTMREEKAKWGIHEREATLRGYANQNEMLQDTIRLQSGEIKNLTDNLASHKGTLRYQQDELKKKNKKIDGLYQRIDSLVTCNENQMKSLEISKDTIAKLEADTVRYNKKELTEAKKYSNTRNLNTICLDEMEDDESDRLVCWNPLNHLDSHQGYSRSGELVQWTNDHPKPYSKKEDK